MPQEPKDRTHPKRHPYHPCWPRPQSAPRSQMPPVVLFLEINHHPGGYHLSLGKSFKMEQKKGRAFLHPLFFLRERLLRGAGRSLPSPVPRRVFLSPLTRMRKPQREASPHLPLLPFLSPSCVHGAFLGSPRLSWLLFFNSQLPVPICSELL